MAALTRASRSGKLAQAPRFASANKRINRIMSDFD